MNIDKNYYKILGIENTSTEKDIKKAYRDLSKKYHPDANINTNIDISYFSEMTEAYDVLCGENRKDYDLKSKFGNNYNEYFELFNIKMDYDYDDLNSKREHFKKNEVNDILLKVDDTFDGSIEFERWVKCKTCDGTGKDMSSKIVIRDVEGNILKVFDGDDGCDLCEGTGKYMDLDCSFCDGKGKVGLNPCKTCNGEKRILGKQKLSGIKLTGDETRVDSMGHHAKNGNVGHLYLIKS